mmetsp:Transcript_37872/g.121861  ORF Transcript_37872/g.121861 Transcript_37872/m.121861 type:complete len:222 (-) Transcript_37872:919-1584(-)
MKEDDVGMPQAPDGAQLIGQRKQHPLLPFCGAGDLDGHPFSMERAGDHHPIAAFPKDSEGLEQIDVLCLQQPMLNVTQFQNVFGPGSVENQTCGGRLRACAAGDRRLSLGALGLLKPAHWCYFRPSIEDQAQGCIDADTDDVLAMSLVDVHGQDFSLQGSPVAEQRQVCALRLPRERSLRYQGPEAELVVLRNQAGEMLAKERSEEERGVFDLLVAHDELF